MPGTRLTATHLTRRVLTTVPPRGAVIVAVAGSEALRDRSESATFTAGPERRVHMTI
ncbi:hypothetical protein [uncultured Brachybacterium sp.]|uniref:hypothetical protein n=1 Tax=uncultured Brachybacterium sp. TaxID=189680 RepID=UPI002632F5C1|nr:hypothetical protein [uncultured Brachybacterium sp.]